jgi:hypothetical protein
MTPIEIEVFVNDIRSRLADVLIKMLPNHDKDVAVVQEAIDKLIDENNGFSPEECQTTKDFILDRLDRVEKEITEFDDIGLPKGYLETLNIDETEPLDLSSDYDLDDSDEDDDQDVDKGKKKLTLLEFQKSIESFVLKDAPEPDDPSEQVRKKLKIGGLPAEKDNVYSVWSIREIDGIWYWIIPKNLDQLERDYEAIRILRYVLKFELGIILKYIVYDEVFNFDSTSQYEDIMDHFESYISDLATCLILGKINRNKISHWYNIVQVIRQLNRPILSYEDKETKLQVVPSYDCTDIINMDESLKDKKGKNLQLKVTSPEAFLISVSGLKKVENGDKIRDILKVLNVVVKRIGVVLAKEFKIDELGNETKWIFDFEQCLKQFNCGYKPNKWLDEEIKTRLNKKKVELYGTISADHDKIMKNRDLSWAKKTQDIRTLYKTSVSEIKVLRDKGGVIKKYFVDSFKVLGLDQDDKFKKASNASVRSIAVTEWLQRERGQDDQLQDVLDNPTLAGVYEEPMIEPIDPLMDRTWMTKDQYQEEIDNYMKVMPDNGYKYKVIDMNSFSSQLYEFFKPAEFGTGERIVKQYRATRYR